MNAVSPLPELAGAERRNRVARIVGEVGERLRRFVRARVRNEEDTEDVVQEVWGEFVSAIDSGPIEQVSSWLYTVARNRIIDRSRKAPMASLDELAEAAPEMLAGPEDGALGTPDQLFWDCLEAALAELPAEQRQVFVWHELEGRSFQEIAERTGENQNTLLARKRYAVLHLRKRLAPLRAEFSR